MIKSSFLPNVQEGDKIKALLDNYPSHKQIFNRLSPQESEISKYSTFVTSISFNLDFIRRFYEMLNLKF